MLVGLVKDMTCIDFGFTKLKAKVLRSVCHRGFIFHVLIGIGGDMTAFDFEFTG